MFRRHEGTYDIREDTLEGILADEANPLNRIAAVIHDGAEVLDIGAGNGLLAAVLKGRKKRVVIDGIEPDLYAASIAKPNYRKFFIGPAQDFIDDIKKNRYDYIVLADVLEHLDDPLQFLRSLSVCVSESARIVLSVPNVAFGSVRLALLNGAFDYVDSGILERTHVRFFTEKTIKLLVSAAGLHVAQIQYLRRNLFETEIFIERYPLELLCLHKVTKDFFSSVYQFVLVLSKTQCDTEIKVFGGGTRNQFVLYLFNKIKRIRSCKSS